MTQYWDSQFYDKKHHFVTTYGNDVLALLKPQPGEIILDLGCGTGALTHSISKLAAQVVGIDSSASMINQAQTRFPSIEFIQAAAPHFHFDYQFDAVFSNAALHWMAQPEHVIAKVHASLKPGGRFVFEMGAYHNIAHVLKSVALALSQFGLNDDGLINYYPKLGAYCTLLENVGFKVMYAETIDRPTRLEGEDGLINWVKMFRSHVLEQVPESEHQAFFVALEKIAKPTLYHHDHWWADYVRLRVVAQKTKQTGLVENKT